MKPCACWLEMWHVHEGHCCFDPEHSGNCHTEEEGTSLAQRRGGWTGPSMARRYWLTEKGYAAVAAMEAVS